jgi:hypothetical protein
LRRIGSSRTYRFCSHRVIGSIPGERTFPPICTGTVPLPRLTEGAPNGVFCRVLWSYSQCAVNFSVTWTHSRASRRRSSAAPPSAGSMSCWNGDISSVTAAVLSSPEGVLSQVPSQKVRNSAPAGSASTTLSYQPSAPSPIRTDAPSLLPLGSGPRRLSRELL